MDELIAYVINDSRCKEAFHSYFNTPNIERWVFQNMELFNTISIRVDGLPSIASCNYQGKHFENIKEFHSFFRKAMEVMDDPFDNNN
jgi:hypothetical protein